MLNFRRSDDQDILIVNVDGPIEVTDFEKFAEEIESPGTSQRQPTRLMVRAESFPGWENFEAFAAHLKFIAEHHKQIQRIAIVTDSELLKLVPQFASLVVHPQIKQFDLAKSDDALAWLATA